MNSVEAAGLYVHIPFCRSKCPYCDFYSTTSLELLPLWLEAVVKEIDGYRGRFALFDSLYLGGGTPSLVDAARLGALIDHLRRAFSFSDDMEITLEANPDDITPGRLREVLDLGVNRISLGVQSLDEGELRLLKRRHTALQAEEALALIRSAGFENVGIDLIYGLPGQTVPGWLKTLDRALGFGPEHLSCYQMTYEEGTLFGKRLKKGTMRALGEDVERAFFLRTSRFLEKRGYLHYEISNFARAPEFVSRHNRKYWRRVPCLGLGPSAHSFDNDSRWWNVRSVSDYARRLMSGQSPVAGRESLTPEQVQLERVSLGLRTSDGVPLETFASCADSSGVLTRLSDSGLITVRGGAVVPTRKGFLVADGLALLF